MNSSPSRRAVLRTVPLAAAAAGLTACTGSETSSRPAGPNPTTPPSVSAGPLGRVPIGRPNVIVISVDDLGWRDLGCYGNTFYETPHIDRLAAEGVAFDQAYAAAPVCSPSRAGLVTGMYPGRVGITSYLRPENAPSNLYLEPRFGGVGAVLGSRGYQVGLVGKWHLSETYSGPERDRPGNPWSLGFTDVRAHEELYIGHGDYFAPYFFMQSQQAPRGEYLTDLLTQDAVDLITQHRHQPFFLHLSNYAVHSEYAAKRDIQAHFEAKPGASDPANKPVRAAMMVSVDDQVGTVRATLEELGIADNTLLLVTSDNGGDDRASNRPLRGGKGELHEAGIRVPLVAWSPGFVRQGHRESTPVSWIDILPTAAELAGTKAPGVDGLSIVPLLTGRGTMAARDALYWDFPHFIGFTHPHSAIREGKWKLIMYLRRGNVELFDLDADPEESRDLAQRQPRIAARLKKKLERHVAELHMFPSAPPGSAAPAVVDLQFKRAPAGWNQIVRSGSGAFAATRAGAWRVESQAATEVWAVSDVTPAATFQMVVDPSQLKGDSGISFGLVKDADNHLMVTYDDQSGKIGWLATVDGVPQDQQVDSTQRLTGKVNPNRAHARLALCMEGHRGSVWFDANRGQGWEFLWRFDVGGVMPFEGDRVREQYRFAVGARARDGQAGFRSLRVTSQVWKA